MFAPTSVLVSVQPEVPAIELGKSAAVRLWQTSPPNGSFTAGAAPRLRIGALGLAPPPPPPVFPPPPPRAATNAAETTMSVAPLNRIRLLHHRAGAGAPGAGLCVPPPVLSTTRASRSRAGRSGEGNGTPAATYRRFAGVHEQVLEETPTSEHHPSSMKRGPAVNGQGSLDD